MRLDERHVLLVGRGQLRADLRQLLAELRKLRHVGVTIVVELVGHHAVETLVHVFQLVQKAQVHLRGEREPVEHLLRLDLRLLDAHADFNLLLAREKRHLSHLMEIHADRIVDRVALRRGLDGLLVLARAIRLHIVGTDHIHVQRLKDRQILVGRRFVLHCLGNDRVELLVGDVAAILLGRLLHLLNDRIALLRA